MIAQPDVAVAGANNERTTVENRFSHRSLWLQEALPHEAGHASPRLEQALSADICIVGGGYTGLWTALRILEHAPGTSVTLVEADICGGGASGRNGGFALSLWPKITSLIHRAGDDEALRIGRASEDAVADIGSFCAAEGIDAHFCQAGWLWTATSAAQRNAWATALETCARLGVQPFQTVDPAEVARRTGSPMHLEGVLEPACATVQPALLARGMRRVAQTRGVRIFERSPMVGIDRDLGIVHTVRGSVTASTIVLATNAWLAGIPELRRAIFPLSSDMVATAPMPARLAESGWTGGESISNSRMMVHYYRTTRDGRIAFGRGGGALAFAGRIGPGFDYNVGRTRAVIADMHRLLPVSHGVDVSHAWGGVVDRSADGLPFFGTLPGRTRILYGAGFSGNGVAPSVLAGRILASAALGLDDEWANCALNRGVPALLPPEPFRFVGGQLVRRAVQRKEERQDAGLPVDMLTRRVAAMVPTGFSRVSGSAQTP